MLGQVMPISCRKNVTMLFSETSLGICTPLRPPSSQLEEALEQVGAEVVEELPEALGQPLQQVVGEAQRVVGDVAGRPS